MNIFPITLTLLAGAVFASAQPEPGKPAPAERGIARAQQEVKDNPRSPDGYNALAMALARRARETADPGYYEQAGEAVRKSLEAAPRNPGALKARVWLLLGKHEFAGARQLAMDLNQRAPDDLMVYGFLADANAELGNYADAEKACNWMLKLRPGNIPALTRAAYLRELFGDLDGAVELMTRAYQAMPAAESEDRAWALTQVAHLQLLLGKAEEAGRILEQALSLFPGYHYALAGLAQVRIAGRRFDEAARLLRRRYDAAPHPENLFDLAEALHLAGRQEEARAAFAKFETAALKESEGADNANRELIYYYADHAGEPAKALRIAEREYGRRRDVFTQAAYAWALHVNGREAEARECIGKALAVGVRDPRVLEQARAIGWERAAAVAIPR